MVRVNANNHESLSIGRAALPIYLPSLLIAIGEGAILPILPATATGLGASLALAGLISGLLMIGEVVGDIPSGWVVSRFGENRSMIVGAGVIAVGVVLCLTAQTLIVLACGVFLMGVASAVFALARHALLTTTIPLATRARALSLLGGTFRLGYFIGPFIAVAVIPWGGTQAVFWINLIGCALTVALLLVLPDPAVLLAGADHPIISNSSSNSNPGAKIPADKESAPVADAPARLGLFQTLVAHRTVLARMGTGALTVGLLRSSRQVILPLWAVHLQLDVSHTALIMGIAGTVDFALFYSSGQIMDRFGRAWSAVPSMIGLGLAHIALVFSGDVTSFAVVAVAMSVANGIGSGILMTMGADLAPRDDPAPFLGAWRFLSDSGSAAAPAIISAVTAAISLASAAAGLGVVGLLGALMLARYIPRYVPKPQ